MTVIQFSAELDNQRGELKSKHEQEMVSTLYVVSVCVCVVTVPLCVCVCAGEAVLPV